MGHTSRAMDPQATYSVEAPTLLHQVPFPCCSTWPCGYHSSLLQHAPCPPSLTLSSPCHVTPPLWWVQNRKAIREREILETPGTIAGRAVAREEPRGCIQPTVCQLDSLVPESIYKIQLSHAYMQFSFDTRLKIILIRSKLEPPILNPVVLILWFAKHLLLVYEELADANTPLFGCWCWSRLKTAKAPFVFAMWTTAAVVRDALWLGRKVVCSQDGGEVSLRKSFI